MSPRSVTVLSPCSTPRMPPESVTSTPRGPTGGRRGSSRRGCARAPSTRTGSRSARSGATATSASGGWTPRSTRSRTTASRCSAPSSRSPAGCWAVAQALPGPLRHARERIARRRRGPRELARLRAEEGLVIGLSVSGPRQADVIRAALEVRVDGVDPFACVQATWNVLEPSAGPALAEAHDAGAGVIVKEAVANGRLAPGGADSPGAHRVAEFAADADTTSTRSRSRQRSRSRGHGACCPARSIPRRWRATPRPPTSRCPRPSPRSSPASPKTRRPTGRPAPPARGPDRAPPASPRLRQRESATSSARVAHFGTGRGLSSLCQSGDRPVELTDSRCRTDGLARYSSAVECRGERR